MQVITKDPLVKVVTLSATPNPQKLCWLAAHQDYSSFPVSDDIPNWSEKKFGEGLVNNCLKFGHWGVIEHGGITFNCHYFPHSVMYQARTHRVGISFDVQSFRYTSESIVKALNSDEELEKAIYFRPVGFYTDRKGAKYHYTEDHRNEDKQIALTLVKHYAKRRMEGFSEEHARGMVPFELRQHFTVSFNPRSLLHFIDLRYKADAQAEIQWLASGIWDEFVKWMPEVAAHYEEKRLGKARLSP